jgi:hypothetical protein
MFVGKAEDPPPPVKHFHVLRPWVGRPYSQTLDHLTRQGQTLFLITNARKLLS